MSAPNGLNGSAYHAEARQKAAALKAYTTPFPIEVRDALGQPLELVVRRPDLRRLAYEGRLETPLLASVAELIGKWVGKDLKDKTDEEMDVRGPETMQLVDRLLEHVLVEPRFVLDASTLDEVDREGVLTPEDLPFDVKETILSAALLGPIAARKAREEEAAGAARFPEGRPGAGAGPDVPPLQPAAEPGAGDS